MAFAGVDLIARLLVVERKDSIPWGVDPAADPDETQAPKPASDSRTLSVLEIGPPSEGSFISSIGTDVKEAGGLGATTSQEHVVDAVKYVITPLDVLLRLLTSPRAVICIFSTFVYG